MENFTREIHQHLNRVGTTPTNSAVEDESSSTNNEEGSIGSIMDDLQNQWGTLFDTDSNSDSELEGENNAVEDLWSICNFQFFHAIV